MTPDNVGGVLAIGDTDAGRQNLQTIQRLEQELVAFGLPGAANPEAVLQHARFVAKYMAGGEYYNVTHAKVLSRSPVEIVAGLDPIQVIEAFDRSTTGTRQPYRVDELLQILETIPPLPIIAVEEGRCTINLEDFLIEAIKYAGRYCPEGAQQALANRNIYIIKTQGEWATYRFIAGNDNGYPSKDTWMVPLSSSILLVRPEIAESFFAYDPSDKKTSNSASRAIFHTARLIRDILYGWQLQGHQISAEFPLSGLIPEPNNIDQAALLEFMDIKQRDLASKSTRPQVSKIKAQDLYSGTVVLTPHVTQLETCADKVANFIREGGFPFPKIEGCSPTDLANLIEKMANWVSRNCATGKEILTGHSFTAVSVDMETFQALSAISCVLGIPCQADSKVVCVPGTNILAVSPLCDPKVYLSTAGPEATHNSYKAHAVLARDLLNIMVHYLNLSEYDLSRFPWPPETIYF